MSTTLADMGPFGAAKRQEYCASNGIPRVASDRERPCDRVGSGTLSVPGPLPREHSDHSQYAMHGLMVALTVVRSDSSGHRLMATMPAVLAHQGGWDEFLYFVVPVVLAVMTLRWVEKRATRKRIDAQMNKKGADEPTDHRSRP